MSTRAPSRSGNENAERGNHRHSAASRASELPQAFQTLTNSVCNAVEDYSRRHPATVATALFFLGFYVGWKVKPW